MNQSVIREITEADLPTFVDLAIRTFRETYAIHNNPQDMQQYMDAYMSKSRLIAEVDEPGSCTLIQWYGDLMAGYARLRRASPSCSISATSHWELERFYVDKPWQGRGLAADLMSACEQETQKRGLDGLWLGVWTENRRARRFYQKMGFREEGSKEFKLGQDVQIDLVLVKTVSA